MNEETPQENKGFIDPKHCHFVSACPHGNFYTCSNCGGSQTTASDIPTQGDMMGKGFKERFDEDLQNRACKNDWKHDYRFSHYEEDRNMSATATLNGKYAIMICRHCGNYIKQQIF